MRINPKIVDIYHLNANNAHGGDGADFRACHAAGFRGIIHKASQGTHIADRLYAERKAKAQAAGLKWAPITSIPARASRRKRSISSSTHSLTTRPKCASIGRTIRAGPAA
jgi:hypothetical protein